jgi:uroporphyrinogen decarboxylase
MPHMSPRERVLAALKRQSPDVVPFDIGGMKTTSLNIHAYQNLQSYVRIDGPTQYGHYRSQRAHMSENLSRFFDADVRRLHVPYPSPLPDSLTRPVQVDEWGSEWTQAPGGLYFVTRPGLAGAQSVSDLRAYAWPEPAALTPVEALAEAARNLRAETDCAVCLDLPDGVVHTSQFVRGFEQWLIDSAVNVPFFESLLDAITDIYVAMVGPLLRAVGESVDVVLHCDDIGTQNGPLIAPEAYRRLIKPRQARILEAIRANTPARIVFHTCGSVRWAVGDIIDMGADALNPVQVSARHMQTDRLKREFGDKITFWGAIDTGAVLPFGTPEDVRQEVRRRIEDLAAGGGYIIGSVHIVQAEVPPQNILAMAEAAHLYGGRSDASRFRNPGNATKE